MFLGVLLAACGGDFSTELTDGPAVAPTEENAAAPDDPRVEEPDLEDESNEPVVEEEEEEEEDLKEEEEPLPSWVPHDPETTTTLFIGGWNLDGASVAGVYGSEGGGGDVGDGIQWATGMPEGRHEPEAANQLTECNYYGDEPADWMTPAQVAVVESFEGVERYARICAMYARMVLDRAPAATGVSLTCHSMGCLVSRYLIEHDLENLASDGLIARWVTFAGVVNGAPLGAAFTGLIDIAGMLGLDLIDVEHMTPEWVAQNVAFDGIRDEGNNPNFGGILIHHLLASKPTLDQALNLPVLEFHNPDDRPNDAIMWTDDEWFHEMASVARYPAADGTLLRSSRSYYNTDHFVINEIPGAHAQAGAALVGSRRVQVTLDAIMLSDDREKDNAFDFSETGTGRAEVMVQTEVWWPWLQTLVGSSPVMGERLRTHRVLPIDRMFEGDVKTPQRVIYEAVVFDEMDAITMHIDAVEVDWYPTEDVNEYAFDPDQRLGETWIDVPLADDVLQLDLGRVVLELQIQMFDL